MTFDDTQWTPVTFENCDEVAGLFYQSYRSRHALRVVCEVEEWEEHSAEVIQRMLDGLAALRAQGRDLIED